MQTPKRLRRSLCFLVRFLTYHLPILSSVFNEAVYLLQRALFQAGNVASAYSKALCHLPLGVAFAPRTQAVTQDNYTALLFRKHPLHPFTHKGKLYFPVYLVHYVLVGGDNVYIRKGVAVLIHIHAVVDGAFKALLFLASEIHEYLVLQAFSRIGGKPRAGFRFERIDGFYKPYGAYRNQIVLVFV